MICGKIWKVARKRHLPQTVCHTRFFLSLMLQVKPYPPHSKGSDPNGFQKLALEHKELIKGLYIANIAVLNVFEDKVFQEDMDIKECDDDERKALGLEFYNKDEKIGSMELICMMANLLCKVKYSFLHYKKDKEHVYCPDFSLCQKDKYLAAIQSFLSDAPKNLPADDHDGDDSVCVPNSTSVLHTNVIMAAFNEQIGRASCRERV